MRKLKFLLAIIALALSFQVLTSMTVFANGKPLPPLPNKSVIDKVISQTNGLPFIPLGTPNYIFTRLQAFSGVFDYVEHKFEHNLTLHYIKTNKQLTESVLPLRNGANQKLDPDIRLPGDRLPGKVIGALFQPSRSPNNVMIVVAVFKKEAAQCPTCYPPEKVRLYTNSTRYLEYSIKWGAFKNGKDKLDDGALISHDLSCVSVGTEQVCWEPYDHNIVRDEPAPKDIVYNAYTSFKNTYNIGVDFYVDDAMPDLVGEERRYGCAAQLRSATSFGSLSQCAPNLVFTAAKERLAGKPLGIFVVLQSADIKTYRASDGVHIGQLPVGKYLVMDASPSKTKPGDIGALFLVNLDTVNHYLIPSRTMAGFNTSAVSEPQAAIKDGYLWSRGFGYP